MKQPWGTALHNLGFSEIETAPTAIVRADLPILVFYFRHLSNWSSEQPLIY